MPDGSDLPRFRVTPRAAAQVADIARREADAPRPGSASQSAPVAVPVSSTASNWWATARRPTTWWWRPGGTRVFVDPVSLDLLAGSELDWNEALIGAHFVVQQPAGGVGLWLWVSFAVA